MKHMLITNKHGSNDSFKICLKGNNVERVPIYKYLGVIVHEKRIWN